MSLKQYSYIQTEDTDRGRTDCWDKPHFQSYREGFWRSQRGGGVTQGAKERERENERERDGGRLEWSGGREGDNHIREGN